MADERGVQRAILDAVPQQEPFRFVDEIRSLGEGEAVAAYRFREDAWFYRGHFPGNPVTPGVILVEAMAQGGLVVLGLYAMEKEKQRHPGQARNRIPLFTRMEEVEFSGVVRPGERVVIRSEQIYFRRHTLKARVTLARDTGETVCSGVLTGMWVQQDAA